MTKASLTDLIAWLQDGARDAPKPEQFLEEMCGRLLAAGLPIDRVMIAMGALHPQYFGVSARWRRGQPVELGTAPYEIIDSDSFVRSPIVHVQKHGRELHRRVDSPAAQQEFGVFPELAAEGFTDYFAAPVVFSDGKVQAAIWVTRSQAGFSEADLAAIRSLLAPLARVLEARSLRRTAVSLLNTYVGKRSGEKILAGRIRLGDVETISAAIWLSDLRGFTELADRLPADRLIELLNRYFGAQVPAIEAAGGEVLKYMGDGLLAIFAEEGGGNPARICGAALDAARAARAAIGELGSSDGSGRGRLGFGIALHCGELSYGNIGSGNRLDFTVIGPAVNLAARLEKLARDRGRSIVASEEFAAFCAGRLVPLGQFTLRGFNRPLAAYGLPEEGEATAPGVN
jgi:adenylate cyclase